MIFGRTVHTIPTIFQVSLWRLRIHATFNILGESLRSFRSSRKTIEEWTKSVQNVPGKYLHQFMRSIMSMSMWRASNIAQDKMQRNCNMNMNMNYRSSARRRWNRWVSQWTNHRAVGNSYETQQEMGNTTLNGTSISERSEYALNIFNYFIFANGSEFCRRLCKLCSNTSGSSNTSIAIGWLL